MKKLFSIAMAILFAGSAVALDNVPKPGTSFQANIGFNVSNIEGLNMMSPKAGLNIGGKIEFMLPNAYGTFINVGLDWTQKGARKTVPSNFSNNVNETRKIQAHYLDLPVHVGYRFNISNKLGVYGEVGPYFGIGVTGKYKKIYDDDETPKVSEMLFRKNVYKMFNENVTNSVRTIQRFDCGFGFRVGMEYNNQYSLNIGGDWGFMDIYTNKYRVAYKAANNGAVLPDLKNHNLYITFGYRF